MKPLKKFTLALIRADLTELVQLLDTDKKSQYDIDTIFVYRKILKESDDFVLDYRTIEGINYRASKFNLTLDL